MHEAILDNKVYIPHSTQTVQLFYCLIYLHDIQLHDALPTNKSFVGINLKKLLDKSETKQWVRSITYAA